MKLTSMCPQETVPLLTKKVHCHGNLLIHLLRSRRKESDPDESSKTYMTLLMNSLCSSGTWAGPLDEDGEI